jgi:hypothetical protein
MFNCVKTGRARTAALAALVGGMCLAALPAHATVNLDFSQLSSDSTPAAALDANVLFSVVGSQLLIDIQNNSLYSVADLYFNTDTDITGLAFNNAGATNAAWGVTGGTSQAQGADGMGSYNWWVTFGSGSNRLGAGTTSLVFDMTTTGPVTEGTIGTKFSINPPGSQTALGVLKFEAGPNDDSAFGGSTIATTTSTVPEPTSMALLGLGALPLLRRLRRRQPEAEATA